MMSLIARIAEREATVLGGPPRHPGGARKSVTDSCQKARIAAIFATAIRPCNKIGAMKRLYLLRHAKAQIAEPDMDDFDRPLAPRGRRTAPRVGAYMRLLGYRPDIALCSPAARALETWVLLRDALGCEIEEEFRDEIYSAAPRTLLDCVRGLDDRHASAILVGHNPGILTLALGLVGRGIGSANPFGKYPTCALTVFDFDVGRWRDVAPGGGILIGFTRPRELDAVA